MRYLPVVILVVLGPCSFLSGCRFTWVHPEVKQFEAIRRMNPQQRRDTFANMPPERQLDIYLAAAGEEPGYDFSLDVSRNWKSLLPTLRERLAKQKGETEQIHLLWLLASISENYCSLSERRDVLEVVSQVIAKMGESGKNYAEEPLRRITHPKNRLMPCQ